MAGLTEEESLDEQKKGPVVYQEMKMFVGEWSIITVYDNQEQKRVTFEVYGCDTSDILRVQYAYNEFDAFFRFNAELMNPNRREGRYHWIAERMEVTGDGAGGRKLGLASEPTPEIPEMPMYEKRKIPTGRMNYSERQRLRESMDQLDIKRNESIAKKRMESKVRFLTQMQEQKAEHQERLKLRSEKIAKEREERWNLKEAERQEELEAHMEMEEKMSVRMANVEQKEFQTQEKDDEEVRKILQRFREDEKRKQEEVEEARKQREAKKKEEVKRLEEARAKALATEKKREDAWKAREGRVEKKRGEWMAELKAKKELAEREEALKAEKKLEFIKDLHVERQKVFFEQNKKSLERQKCAEETKPVEDAGAEKPPEEHKKEKPDKEGKKARIDAVEKRMREELKRNNAMKEKDAQRQTTIAAKEKKRIMEQAEHAKQLRNQKRTEDAKKNDERDQKAVIVAQKKEEEKRAAEKAIADAERQDRLRQENIDKKLVNRSSTAECKAG